MRAADVAGAGPERPAPPRRAGHAGRRCRAHDGEVGSRRGAADHDRRAAAGRAPTRMVMVEDSRLSPDGATVELTRRGPGRDHVRPAGDDVRPGDLVVPAGHRARPGPPRACWPRSASSRSTAYPRARVGVVSTGDELVEGPVPLGPGQIRDSNRRTLLALLAESGCEPVDLGLIRDDEALHHRRLRGRARAAATRWSPPVACRWASSTSSSGCSTGWARSTGCRWPSSRPSHWPSATSAASPTFGLPGNPVSSMVSFELFARPALRRMMGHAAARPADRVRAVAPEGLRRRPDGRVQFFRVGAALGRGAASRCAPPAARAPTSSPAWRRPTGWRWCDDGDGVPPGGRVEVILLSLPGQ